LDLLQRSEKDLEKFLFYHDMLVSELMPLVNIPQDKYFNYNLR